MARPTDRAEAKTELLNIRVTPTLKRMLLERADQSGRKLSSECEMRLHHSLHFDLAITLQPSGTSTDFARWMRNAQPIISPRKARRVV